MAAAEIEVEAVGLGAAGMAAMAPRPITAERAAVLSLLNMVFLLVAVNGVAEAMEGECASRG